jgi:hypothetical protein
LEEALNSLNAKSDGGSDLFCPLIHKFLLGNIKLLLCEPVPHLSNITRVISSRLQWEEALNSFKAKLDGGSDVFGPLIHKFLLGNKHRVSVVMLPDSSLAAKTEESERAKLDNIRAQLSEQEVRRQGLQSSWQKHAVWLSGLVLGGYKCPWYTGSMHAAVSRLLLWQRCRVKTATVHAVLS